MSFLALVAMIANKIWHVRTGKISEPHHLHLVGPVVTFLAKTAHLHSSKVYTKVRMHARPTLLQAKKDIMLFGYDASASLAKRFAKIANEIKGKGVLPETHETSFHFAYLKNQE